MKKYSTEKHEIVRLVSEGMLTANKAATKYGVNKSDVQKWTAAYEGLME